MASKGQNSYNRLFGNNLLRKFLVSDITSFEVEIIFFQRVLNASYITFTVYRKSVVSAICLPPISTIDLC